MCQTSRIEYSKCGHRSRDLKVVKPCPSAPDFRSNPAFQAGPIRFRADTARFYPPPCTHPTPIGGIVTNTASPCGECHRWAARAVAARAERAADIAALAALGRAALQARLASVAAAAGIDPSVTLSGELQAHMAALTPAVAADPGVAAYLRACAAEQDEVQAQAQREHVPSRMIPYPRAADDVAWKNRSQEGITATNRLLQAEMVRAQRLDMGAAWALSFERATPSASELAMTFLLDDSDMEAEEGSARDGVGARLPSVSEAGTGSSTVTRNGSFMTWDGARRASEAASTSTSISVDPPEEMK